MKLAEYFKDRLITMDNINRFINDYGGCIVKTIKGNYLVDQKPPHESILYIRLENLILLDSLKLIDSVIINTNYLVSVEKHAPLMCEKVSG